MNELNIPADFDWKTTKDYILTLKTDTEGIVEINNNSGITYQRVYLKWNEVYVMKLTVPSYEKNIVVKFYEYEKSIDLVNKSIPIFFQKM